jgi:phosphomannomutase
MGIRRRVGVDHHLFGVHDRSVQTKKVVVRECSMPLMVSVSGIRGIVGEDFTPPVVVRHIAAFIRVLGGTPGGTGGSSAGRILMGRDTRPSGRSIERLTEGTVSALGFDSVTLGVATTPTVLMLTRTLGCTGGVVITASHNPPQWNALKLCDGRGLFLSEDLMRRIHETASALGDRNPGWKRFDGVGMCLLESEGSLIHAESVARAIDAETIRRKRFKVVVDPGGGAGTAIDRLFLEMLGCRVIVVNELGGNGVEASRGVNDNPEESIPRVYDFPRPPEPTPGNLSTLCARVRAEGADIGFAQDPDGDRLAVVSEKGAAVGEEYTLVLAGEAFLGKQRSGIACNLSTSLMVDDLAERHGVTVERTRIGELHVTSRLLEKELLFGGEGNGGVIVPSVNPCRDSIVGMGLILELLATTEKTVSQLVSGMPAYCMKKEKCRVPGMEKERLYSLIRDRVAGELAGYVVDDTDGIKASRGREWVHLRLSNTEPVMRIMAEGSDEPRVDRLIAFGTSFADSLKKNTGSG